MHAAVYAGTMTRPPIAFIRKLCAHLSESDIQEAEERFWEYLELLRDIVLRRQQGGNPQSRFDKSDP